MKLELEEWMVRDSLSVQELIEKLNDIVEENPHIDFRKVGISLNQEYTARKVRLDFWTVSPELMRCQLEIE